MSRERPIAPLLQVFRRLRDKVPAAHLHVFGRGDPESFAEWLDQLSLRPAITFHGHSNDLRRSVIDHNVTCGLQLISWVTGGYAAIELVGIGLPMVYWNNGYSSCQQIRAAAGGQFPVFDDADSAASFCHRLSTDGNLRREVVELEQQCVRNRHVRSESLTRIEDFYRDPSQGAPLPRGLSEEQLAAMRSALIEPDQLVAERSSNADQTQEC